MKALFFWRSAVLGATLVLGLAGQARALGSLADIQVYDRATNRRLPVYWHEGKAYVVGNPGDEYRIGLANHSGGDILAVVSVDGVNAVSGETASPDQTGYVLGPWRAFDILGWRKSLTRTAAFYFTQLPDSYAARTGRPDNVGVIGVAVFRRKPEPASIPAPIAPPISRAEPEREDVPYRDRAAPSSAAPATPQPGAAAGAAENRSEASSDRVVPRAMEKGLGTGHGRSETSVVRNVAFERATPAPEEIVTIYYDSLRNLVAMGVVPAPAAPWSTPQPFPGRFVPDPPRG
jgi:hypothetical protein